MKSILCTCLLFVVFVNSSCRKSTLPADLPRCIKAAIEANKNNIDWEVGSVEEYRFQGNLVYAFAPSKYIADAPTVIKTSDCDDLCSVGGFGGPSINLCNGDDFFQNAVLVRKIWEQP